MNSENQNTDATTVGEEMKLHADNSIEVTDGVRVAKLASNGVLTIEFTQEALLTKYSDDPEVAKKQSEERLKLLLAKLDEIPSIDEMRDIIKRNKL